MAGRYKRGMSVANELMSPADGAIVSATNAVRDRVVHALAGYLELSASMRELEDAFSTQVLHTARRLHDMVEARTRLEAEHRRIRARLDRGGYASDEELAEDVRAALTDDAETARDTVAVAEVPEPDEDLDPATKDRIVREFKRIVLPRVHADTSATPYAVYEVAYAAYRGRDHTVMAAFVVEYRGRVTDRGDDGRALTHTELAARLADYEVTERRLDGRCAALCGDLTEDELRDPAGARERMARQHEQFRQAIVAEADRLREVRERLAALAGSGVA